MYDENSQDTGYQTGHYSCSLPMNSISCSMMNQTNSISSHSTNFKEKISSQKGFTNLKQMIDESSPPPLLEENM